MKYSNLQIGDKIRILSKPKYWCSHFNINNPLDAGLVFPYEGIITQVEDNDNNGYRGMELGGFSWDLLETNYIIINKEHYDIY